MITVCFHGGLRGYGRRFDLYAASPAEALRALLCQLPGLSEVLRTGFYQVRFNRHDFSEAELQDGFREAGSGILHIVPRIQGAGRAGQIVLGAVLIVAALWTGGWSLAGMTSLGSAAFSAGVGLVLGGIAQMLVRPPRMDLEQRGQKAGRNTAFSNLDNTAAQGQPVPLAYGEPYCGSRVVSQGVVSRRVDTNGDPIMKNPEATDITLKLVKTYVAGKAAKAPNGQFYNTDFNDDSVRARNYVATLQQN